MSFLLYFVGAIVFIAGLAWLATVAGLSQGYIAIAALVMLVLAFVTASAHARTKRPA